MLERFYALDRFLVGQQDYWRFEPFFQSIESHLPWENRNPALCDWLSQLSPGDITHYKTNLDSLIVQLSAYLPELDIMHQLTKLPSSTTQPIELARNIDTGIPGRKLAQIVSMSEFVLAHHVGNEWLEWCSGKGFLGRILASQTRQKVTSLEYDSALCQAGQELATKYSLPMEFVQGDALSEQCLELMNPDHHAVALHACGDLHVSLIKQATLANIPAMSISPCCYHLSKETSYQALSKQGKKSQLRLQRSELRIPLQETVTGGERVKRHRMLEMTYRLGFDLILRTINKTSEYQPIPSIKKSALADGFPSFCRWASMVRDVDLTKVDFIKFEKLATERYWHMERLSLMQQPFRRLIEIWLVLDKALYLEENNYKTQLFEFCEKSITPRNLLLHAERR